MPILYSLVDQDILDGLKQVFVTAFNLNKESFSNENWVALKKCEDSYMSYIQNHAAKNEAIEINSTKNKRIEIKSIVEEHGGHLKMWLHPEW